MVVNAITVVILVAVVLLASSLHSGRLAEAAFSFASLLPFSLGLVVCSAAAQEAGSPSRELASFHQGLAA